MFIRSGKWSDKVITLTSVKSEIILFYSIWFLVLLSVTHHLPICSTGHQLIALLWFVFNNNSHTADLRQNRQIKSLSYSNLNLIKPSPNTFMLKRKVFYCCVLTWTLSLNSTFFPSLIFDLSKKELFLGKVHFPMSA